MDNLIDVTETGTERKVSILVSNVIKIEAFFHPAGGTVTRITFVNNQTIDVMESQDELKRIINVS